MTISERTNQDNIKVAITERGIGQCCLTFSPPMKLRAQGWVSFERGPFPRSQVQEELTKHGALLQHMVCEFLGCTLEDLDDKSYVDFAQAVEFYRPEAYSLSSTSSASHSAA